MLINYKEALSTERLKHCIVAMMYHDVSLHDVDSTETTPHRVDKSEEQGLFAGQLRGHMVSKY